MLSSPKRGCSGIEYRSANETDAPALSLARSAFWKDQISKGCLDHPDVGTEEMLAETRSLTKRARTVLLIATDGAAIIAYVLAQIKLLPGSQGASVSSIEEIYVDGGYRRSAVGRQLVEKVMSRLKDLGATRIQLRVVEGNDSGKSFWQKIGFSPAVVIYEYLK